MSNDQIKIYIDRVIETKIVNIQSGILNQIKEYIAKTVNSEVDKLQKGLQEAFNNEISPYLQDVQNKLDTLTGGQSSHSQKIEKIQKE
ncbi:MAG: hypothetical protein ACXAC7_24315, partial [Candidatus Hodarchaeales archaeon]